MVHLPLKLLSLVNFIRPAALHKVTKPSTRSKKLQTCICILLLQFVLAVAELYSQSFISSFRSFWVGKAHFFNDLYLSRWYKNRVEKLKIWDLRNILLIHNLQVVKVLVPQLWGVYKISQIGGDKGRGISSLLVQTDVLASKTLTCSNSVLITTKTVIKISKASSCYSSKVD